MIIARLMRITLAADCGDGLIEDDVLIPTLDAANIACGAHSVAVEEQRHCIHLCLAHSVDIGAAPDSVERTTLGTRIALTDPGSLATSVCRQVMEFRRLCNEENATLRFVRMRGTLQAFASTDPDVAVAIAESLAAIDRTLTLVAPAESHLFRAARRAGLRASGEMFADRIYDADGTLRGRSMHGALIDDFDACLRQALSITQQHCVTTHNGTRIFIDADTICLDAHVPRAAARALFLRRGLTRAGVTCSGYAATTTPHPE